MLRVDDMDITIILKNWVAIIAAVAGLLLSLYNFFKARRAEDAAKRREDEDWAKYVELIKQQRKNPTAICFNPDLGSEDHRWAERMVVKGFLERMPLMLGYTLKYADCS